MVATSVKDARTVVLVERLLKAGYVIASEYIGNMFQVTLGHEDYTIQGYGDTFTEAISHAAREFIP
jgi:hypothetical protein